MTVFTLGQAGVRALGGIARQTRSRGDWREPRARVRRGGIEAGTFEEQFFMVPAKGETDQLLRVARRALDAGRRLRRDSRAGDRTLTAIERRIAALTAGAVRVYEEIVTLARLNRGRVFPSYDHLAEATSLGRATIARALHILEDIGFIIRQRRFRRIASESAGPRIKQTSNVYRPTLPRSVLAYLPRWMRPAPPPGDLLQHHATHAAASAAMLKTLACRELASIVADGALGEALAKLGAGIDRRERESQIEARSLQQSYE